LLLEHLARLKTSCELLGIPLSQDVYLNLFHLCCEVSLANDHGPGEEHRLLIVVSPGCAPMYQGLAGVIPHPFVYIADFPLRYTVAGFSKYFTDGVHCVTSPVQQVPDACIPSAAKHRSRMHFHLAQQQAPAGTWPILMSGGIFNRVCEAPGANLVWIKNGAAYPVRKTCLAGISLQTVIELTATDEGRETTAATLRNADELWLTGTPFCMLPVVSLDGRPIGDGTIGPVFKQTLAKWSTLVGVDIQQQICDWDRPSTLWTPDAQRLSATQH
jgi:branched-chain amino acid aminotransferase